MYYVRGYATNDVGTGYGAEIIFTTLKPNSPPVITSINIVPDQINTNVTVNVTVEAVDPDNDDLTYIYGVTGGKIDGSGSIVQWVAPSREGLFHLTVQVIDGRGGTATGNGTLSVIAPPTEINGIASFPSGTSGNLAGSVVSIYTNYDNWLNNLPHRKGGVDGTGSSVTFSLQDVPEENYYLDIWKDNDNNAVWSKGDFVGWYGSGGLGSPSLTEIQVSQGKIINIEVRMWIY